MAGSRQSYISKSAYLAGLQCHKLLWYRFNAKGQFPPTDASTQATFDQGHEVGELAKQLFPGGIEVGQGLFDRVKIVNASQSALQSRVPLFEAGFAFQGAYARVDILDPVGKDAWDIIEVKSTTEVKPEHLPDLAIQKYACTGAGLKIRKCQVLHINSDYVRHGPVDPRQLFVQEDVTGLMEEAFLAVKANLQKMFQTIQLKTYPAIPIGPHCDDPYTCPLHDLCWSFLPEASVFTLYRGGKKSFTLFKQGIQHLEKIPADFALTDNQNIQRSALLAGKPHIDRTALAQFLKQLEYPISFLDFETFAPAIPLFDDARPFQQIPFQFSLHILRSANAKPEHSAFLAEGTADPRPEFMRRLREALPDTGSVVTYNAVFEKNCLREACELLPEFKPWFRKVTPRIVDLLLPFRGFRYYHPQQHGSASMKAVLPALTGKGYENLTIQEGGTASREFLRVTYGQVTAAERRSVRQHLEEYCGLDTMGMVEIVRQLRFLGQT